MTVADLTEGHQAHCLPHLLMLLRMLAGDDAEAPSSWRAMAEVAQATDAILAEVEVAGREARAATGRPGPRHLPERAAEPARRPRPATPLPRPGRETSPSCAVTCTGSRC